MFEPSDTDILLINARIALVATNHDEARALLD
jgi:hypothetical protein